MCSRRAGTPKPSERKTSFRTGRWPITEIKKEKDGSETCVLRYNRYSLVASSFKVRISNNVRVRSEENIDEARRRAGAMQKEGKWERRAEDPTPFNDNDI